MIIATNGKGKNYEEYKIIRYKNTVFLTPPSSEQALNPPPLKEEELNIAMVIKITLPLERQEVTLS